MVPNAASASGMTRSAWAASSATTTSSEGTTVATRAAHSRVVAVGVHAEAVGHALAAVDEDAAVLQLVAHHVVGADLARRRAAHHDVEPALVGREGQAVGTGNVAHHDARLAVAVDAIDVGRQL